MKLIYSAIIVIGILGCNLQKSHEIIESTNAKLHMENGVMYYIDAPFSGDLVTYYENNILKSDIEYVNGRKHGTEKHWYQNTTRAITRFYKNGLKYGLHQGWWENGTPKFEYNFNDIGAYHGSVKEWDERGLLVMFFNYENGQENGSQRLWKTDGSIKANYEVLNGERFGLIGLKKCYQVTVGNDEVK